MVERWRMAPFRDCLTRVERKILVDDSVEYESVGVRWYGNGAFVRTRQLGMEIARKQQWLVHEGDVVYNKLFAWKGAFAVADATIHGRIVSDKFPTYRPTDGVLDARYLALWFRLPRVAKQAEAMSKGAAAISKLTLNPPQFWDLTIPLPPLDEQLRIVAQVEAIAMRIKEAQRLRGQGVDQASALLAAIEARVWPHELLATSPTLTDVTTFLARGRQSSQGESNHVLVKTQHVQLGRLLPSRLMLAPEAAAKVPDDARLQQEDVLIACSAAGCLGRVARYFDDGRSSSTDTHVAIARADRSVIHPEYLYLYLLSATGQHELRSRERGDWEREKIGFRLTELNLGDLRKVPVPLPGLTEQMRIANEIKEVRVLIDGLAAKAQAALRELDALLPAVLDRALSGGL